MPENSRALYQIHYRNDLGFCRICKKQPFYINYVDPTKNCFVENQRFTILDYSGFA